MATFLESLEKFRALLDSEDSRKKKILEIIKEECGVTLSEKQLGFHNSTLTISGSPLARSTIFTKKSKLLERFQKELATKKPTDIR